jgi:arginyl-tRNA--protein-N-Asp/Glu arginylyltransferase
MEGIMNKSYSFTTEDNRIIIIKDDSNDTIVAALYSDEAFDVFVEGVKQTESTLFDANKTTYIVS